MRAASLFAAIFLAFGCGEQAGAPAPSGNGPAVSAVTTSVFRCAQDSGAALISAHRGGPAPGYPENAIETFERTRNSGPAVIEIDVASSADGVLFLMHDDRLDRTTTGSGVAAEQDWADIRDLRLVDPRGRATNFNPPTFEEALEWARGRALLTVDIKRSARYEDVVSEVEAAGAEDHVTYIMYTEGQLRAMRRFAPDAVFSVEIESIRDLESALDLGLKPRQILAWLGTDEPDENLLEALDARGVPSILGTLGGRNSLDRRIAERGDDSAYVRYADLGVDMLATDRPFAALKALNSDPGLHQARAACGLS